MTTRHGCASPVSNDLVRSESAETEDMPIMGELVPGLSLKAAILGFDRSDHVLELIEYPGTAVSHEARSLTNVGISHVGLVCDDLVATRSDLEQKGVSFLTSGVAGIAGLRTTWFEDPYGTIFILMEKGESQAPYWRQPAPGRPTSTNDS